MTETKYVLTGDEPHWTGETVREFYPGAKFPLVVAFARKGFRGCSDVYRDVGDPLELYYVNEGTPVKEAEESVGRKLWAFVTKDGERISMPTPVSYDFSFYETPTTSNRAELNTGLGFDVVEKAEHYNTNLPEGVEAIDIIAAQVESLYGIRAFCHANLLKYALRWQKKNGVEDLKKARYYIDRLIEEIENND